MLPAAKELIDRAMDADPRLIADGCSRLIPFLTSRNRKAEAHRYLQRATREATRTHIAEEELSQVSAFDHFVPTGCRVRSSRRLSRA
jgi:hypothetical protein